MDAGVTAEKEGCNASNIQIQNSMNRHQEMGYVCKDSWWLAPACAELGDSWKTQCFAVIDDDWGYMKPELYEAMAVLGFRAAKLTVGYDPMSDIVNGLHESGHHNVTFCWWSSDTTFLANQPVRIALPPAQEPNPAIVSKFAWNRVVQVSPPLKFLMQTMAVDQKRLASILAHVAAAEIPNEDSAPAYFQKLACDWLRDSDNEEIWKSWLPNAKSCTRGEGFDEAAKLCKRCEPGTGIAFIKGVSSCILCRPGTFSSKALRSLESVCVPCEAGSYQAVAGQLHCIQPGWLLMKPP